MTRDELIARLEVATEGSSELDWWVYLTATKKGRIVFTLPLEHQQARWPKWIKDNPIEMRFPHDHDGGIRPYTRSTDAALTLVPEGACVRDLGQSWDTDHPSKWFCTVMKWVRWECATASHIMERYYTHGGAPTAALTICIAAMKAGETDPYQGGEEENAA